MNQELFAGIVLCIMGLCMLLISPLRIWAVTDKWKTAGARQPSRSFVIITRILGIVFLLAGGYLLACGLK